MYIKDIDGAKIHEKFIHVGLNLGRCVVYAAADSDGVYLFITDSA